MTTPTVTHAHVSLLPDDPAQDVSSGEWNANHTITNLVSPQDVLWKPGSNALDDEFNDSSLDAAWLRVDPAAHGTVLTESADVLSMYHAASADSSAMWHGIVKPIGALAIGNSITAGARMATAGGGFPMVAVVLSSSATYGAGSQVMACVYSRGSTSGNKWVASLRRGSNWNTESAATDGEMDNPGSVAIHLRLKWASANNWTLYYSPDGVSWLDAIAASFTMTPTHMGLAFSTWTNGSPQVYSWDYFRVL